MAEKKKFEGLKVGDAVYVVFHRGIGAKHGTVTKVGRKYGYVRYSYAGGVLRSEESPFCLWTGESVDGKDTNARRNGWGYDVYHSQTDYEVHLEENRRRDKLASLFVNQSISGKYDARRAVAKLSMDAVNKITQIIEEELRSNG